MAGLSQVCIRSCLMRSTMCLRFASVVRAIFCGLVLLGLFSQSATRSFAGLFTLTDENSQVDFDTASSANAFNWRVDGGDQLFQQAFWFRVGNTPEQSVHSLPVAFELASNTNSDPGL